jgi:hypothetical protein
VPTAQDFLSDERYQNGVINVVIRCVAGRDILQSELGDKLITPGNPGSKVPYVRSYIARSSRMNAVMTTCVGLNIEEPSSVVISECSKF